MALDQLTLTEPRLDTVAIHGGQDPDPSTGAILAPIYQTTTYVQEAVGVDKGYTYSRSSNPTVSALERKLGALENALPASCFGTGLAAETTLFLTLLRAGDHVVLGDVVYGGTVRLLTLVLSQFGVDVSYADTSTPDAIEAKIRPETRLVFVESPANPTLKLTDIAATARVAQGRGVLLAVDNTVLTPALQSPLDLGADVVVHSTTKYIDGHNATVGGALVTRDATLDERFRFTRNATGAIQSPMNAWLTLQGSKTLNIRVQRHSENALAVARWLETHPRVRNVTYPFLESHPQVELARRQQRAGGGLVTFEVEGGEAAGRELMRNVRLCKLAENLGSVETLVTHPATMTHAAVPPERRAATGITDGLVRLSVGLEDPADVIADLTHALAC